MSEITVLKKPAEEMDDLDQKFDLVYLDPPFGLQRDFNMVEKDGREKGFSDSWKSFDDYIAVSYTHLTLPTICSV